MLSWMQVTRAQKAHPFGFLFVNCRLKKESPAMADNSVTLGRPWHPTTTWADGSRSANPQAVGSVVYKNCWMDAHISAKGWDAMAGKDKTGEKLWFYPEDSRFFEFGSTGPGAIKSEMRRVLSATQAQKYSIANVLGGWEPSR